MSDILRARLGEPHATLRRNRGWFIALGVILLVLGFLAFMNLLVATVVSVHYVGILMLIGGIVQVVHAFRVRGWRSVAPWMVSGILYAIAGVLVVANPVLATSVLTLLISAALLASGILRIVVVIRERPSRGWGWGWVLTAGVLSIIAALIILAGWPVNSLWILGMFLAADLILQGRAWLAVGMALDKP